MLGTLEWPVQFELNDRVKLQYYYLGHWCIPAEPLQQFYLLLLCQHNWIESDFRKILFAKQLHFDLKISRKVSHCWTFSKFGCFCMTVINVLHISQKFIQILYGKFESSSGQESKLFICFAAMGLLFWGIHTGFITHSQKEILANSKEKTINVNTE